MRKILLLISALMLSIVASWAHDVEIDGIYYYLKVSVSGEKYAGVTFKGETISENLNVYEGTIIVPSTIVYESETYKVIEICRNAFYNCMNLTSVEIGENITYIAPDAFSGCSNLTSIVWNSKKYVGVRNFGLGGSPILPDPGEGKVTICVQAPGAMCGYIAAPGTITNWSEGLADDKALSLVEGTTTWYAGTFDWQDGVTFKLAATDADGVWSWNSQLSDGELLAGDCSTELTKDINIFSGNQVIYIKINEFKVNPCNEKLRSAVNNDHLPFKEVASQITSFTFGDKVEIIQDNLCKGMINLKEIVIPNSVISIGDYAFYDCKSIKSVEMSNSVKSIARNAFYGCDNISKVNYLGSVDEWVGIDLDSDLLYYAEDLYINDELLTDVVIISADTIKPGAFYYCKSIKTVELGSSVKYIGDNAFTFCNGITSLSIGENVQYVGHAAFYDCLNLKNVTAYPRVVPNTGQVNYVASIFGTYIAYLNVPCESLEAYELDNVFGQFKYIRCIEEEEEAPEDVEIEVDDNGNVNIKWPPTEGANSYKLVVSHAGNVICTLQFNSMGQLTSIDLGTRSASVGFEFTVTGLTQGSKYSYEMTALSASEDVLEYYAGAFITNGYEEGDDDVTTSVDEAMSDVIISVSNGLVNCSDANIVIYNVSGQNVTAQNGALTSGVYMVQVGDAYVKVMMK